MSANHHVLPEKMGDRRQVMEQVRALKAEMTPKGRGRLSSTAFQGHGEAGELVLEAAMEFMSWNGLFTFQEGAAAKLENDVLDICVSLATGGDASLREQARANLTSGGTESNFCALHAMRNWARQHKSAISKPEVVAPYSTHATIHKVARHLDIQVITVEQAPDLTCDLAALEAAIGPNTIGIIGSAPNWPYGHVDPIKEMGELAQKYDLWLHVDACVGAYVLPFFETLGEHVPAYDFRVPGVRSMSGDLHKYAYAPKPCSTVLWRSQEEQGFHYMPITEWPCGLYLSQSLIGSRSMGPIAGIWALMHYWGRQGYLDNARELLKIKNKLTSFCESRQGIKTWSTQGPLMMIASDDFNIQLLVGGMEQRGWRLLGVTTPPAIHLTIDVMSEQELDQFISDMDQVVEQILSGALVEEGLLSYGGVGAEEDAPKWLLSAVEIFEAGS